MSRRMFISWRAMPGASAYAGARIRPAAEHRQAQPPRRAGHASAVTDQLVEGAQWQGQPPPHVRDRDKYRIVAGVVEVCQRATHLRQGGELVTPGEITVTDVVDVPDQCVHRA
jgi:hypothetical protein